MRFKHACILVNDTREEECALLVVRKILCPPSGGICYNTDLLTFQCPTGQITGFKATVYNLIFAVGHNVRLVYSKEGFAIDPKRLFRPIGLNAVKCNAAKLVAGGVHIYNLNIHCFANVCGEVGIILNHIQKAQIELRLLAVISDDAAMKQAFIDGQDIHTATACRVFGVEPDQVTVELRKRAKAVNFGIVYGMGEFSLSEDLHISIAAAKEYIRGYMAGYPGVSAYLSDVVKQAYDDGYVTTVFGRRRAIPDLAAQNKNLKHFGERVAMNSPIQGTAADIIKIAMIRVDRALKESGLDARLILQVHDELVVECHKDCRDTVLQMLQQEMEHAADFSVPLSVDAKWGKDWYEAH